MSFDAWSTEKEQRPASPQFICISFVVAFILNLMPWGQVYGVPDFVALVLLFWAINESWRVGLGVAFLLGLFMDANNATFLGETALAYTLMTYFAITLHRQILWFPLKKQIWYILPLLFVPQFVQLMVQYLAGNRTIGWFWILDCVIGTVIWPLVYWLLTWPQRRADSARGRLA